MPLLMLKKARPSQLVRNARDEAGNVLRRYEFEPGGVLEVHADDIVVVAEDILADVLIPVKFENYKPVPVEFDREDIAAALADHRAELKAKALAPKPPKATKREATGNDDAPAEPKAGKSRSRKTADTPTPTPTGNDEPKADDVNDK